MKKSENRTHFSWFLLLYLMLLCMTMLSCAGHNSGKPTRQEIEREIRRELPIGSSSEHIEAYLTRKGLEYSFVEGKQPRTEGPPHYQAMMRNVSRGLFFSEDLWIKVYVDEQKRVKSIDIQVLHVP